MNEEIKTIVFKNYISGQVVTLQAKQETKVGELLELIEQVAKHDNKSSGDINEIHLYLKAQDKILQLTDSVGSILKGITFGEIEIRQRFSQTYSELQPVTILILLQSYLGDFIRKLELKLSRFDKLSLIEDIILRQLNKDREAYKISFLVKGNLCQSRQSLADLDLMNNDEILVIVPIILKIHQQEVGEIANFQKYFCPYDSLEDVYNYILEYQSLLKEQVSLELIIKNKTYNSSQWKRTLSELKLVDYDIISVKYRFSGGFQRKKNQN
ncbi:unnamed protein product [Paramecium octaurelia]|uniref:Uncharacterized protein n=1 Tax=Paramecium octaurelia TaxID=43137 RepID=A0A8S1S5L2_PAROT|nr:unnamed protein product [Paramecium octaurelia]